MLRAVVTLGILACIVADAGCQSPAEATIDFEDVTEQVGLGKLLERWRYGHGAAWGDADGDGRPDLYVGAFADREMYAGDDAPIPNMLLLNRPNGFELSEDKAVRLESKRARSTSALLVDLDNDGDLDLVVSCNVSRGSSFGSVLFENLGGGRFRDVTPEGAPWPHELGLRNVAAIDMNADGLLDLIFTDEGGRRGGGQLIVLENKGKWGFAMASAKYGFPATGTRGLGLAVGDVNEDGVLDIFVADSNRLFVSGRGGKYHEVQPGTFVKPGRGEPVSCGAAFGDLNGDGLLDLVTTVHGQPSRIHVYLNEAVRDGDPHFVQITTQAGVAKDFPSWGITKMRVKNAHVALRDIDNDGRTDIILCQIYKDDRGRVQPVVLRNLGNQNGVPRFTRPPYESVISYYAPVPVGDYDRDGRVDIFCTPWFEEIPGYLFRNTTKGGHWLTVRVAGKEPRLNTMGVGATVRVYEAGRAGDRKYLIGRQDIAIGTGYACGEEALAHIGLGKAAKCDVEAAWGKQRVRKTGVPADQMVTITFEGK